MRVPASLLLHVNLHVGFCPRYRIEPYMRIYLVTRLSGISIRSLYGVVAYKSNTRGVAVGFAGVSVVISVVFWLHSAGQICKVAVLAWSHGCFY